MRGARERVGRKRGAVALRFTAVPGKEAPLWRNGRCHTPLTDLPGRGSRPARALDKLGLSTVADLLAYFPREYEDRTVREGIAWLPADTPVCFAAVVAEPFRTSYIRKGMELTKGRIVDGTGQAAVTFFNQNYVRKALQPGQTYFFYGTLTGEGYRPVYGKPRL